MTKRIGVETITIMRDNMRNHRSYEFNVHDPDGSGMNDHVTTAKRVVETYLQMGFRIRLLNTADRYPAIKVIVPEARDDEFRAHFMKMLEMSKDDLDQSCTDGKVYRAPPQVA